MYTIRPRNFSIIATAAKRPRIITFSTFRNLLGRNFGGSIVAFGTLLPASTWNGAYPVTNGLGPLFIGVPGSFQLVEWRLRHHRIYVGHFSSGELWYGCGGSAVSLGSFSRSMVRRLFFLSLLLFNIFARGCRRGACLCCQCVPSCLCLLA